VRASETGSPVGAANETVYFLLAPLGIRADIFALMSVGATLRKQGHSVCVATHPELAAKPSDNLWVFAARAARPREGAVPAAGAEPGSRESGFRPRRGGYDRTEGRRLSLGGRGGRT